MRRRKYVNTPSDRNNGLAAEWLLFALYFSCIILLIFSRLENKQIAEIRGLLTGLVSPVLQAASQPALYVRRRKEQIADYLVLFEELDRLKEENRKLLNWQWRAKRLDRRLVQYRSLLKAVEDPALKYATGQVIADARGPFARSILINLGRERGIRNGYAVINGDGFVGRIVHTGGTSSRAILLNDLNSRIPVLVGAAEIRAVLIGDNSASPQLKFLSQSAEIYEGDEVSTSGHGGVLPRGLRIGVVVPGSGGTYTLRPHAALGGLEYVSVLFFDTPVVIARDTLAGGKTRMTQALPPGNTPAGRKAQMTQALPPRGQLQR